MKKLLISPFTKDECPLIRYRHLINDYEIVAAVPEKGYGLEGKDACSLDGGETTGFVLCDPYRDELPPYDVILSEINKNILVPLGREILPTKELKNIPVPVVTVMGWGSNCQKFDIQLGLREAFLKKGYRVSQFGTKNYSGLFGFDHVPIFENLPLWKKVYAYNEIFYKKCKDETPDVIIIGVPGGIMPITSYSNEKFGETALAIAFAAKPDLSILSCYFSLPTQEYFDLYRQFMRFRLGANDVIFHMSNTNVDNDKNLKRLSYLKLDSQFVLKELLCKTPEFAHLLFNALITDSANSAYSDIIKKLQENMCFL